MTKKRKDGRQTQILCSRFDIDPVELAHRMFGRWKQENRFKYMGEQFALDVLVDYATEPDDPDRLVVNPAWRTLYREIKMAATKLQEAEAAYGRMSPDLLTSPCSFLTAFGARFDVEAEVEVGFRQGHVQGVDLITQ